MRLKNYSQAATIITGSTDVPFGLHDAVADQSSREAADITFLMTASGVTLFGIGAAVRSLVAGAPARLI